jgi:hypothetical protein
MLDRYLGTLPQDASKDACFSVRPERQRELAAANPRMIPLLAMKGPAKYHSILGYSCDLQKINVLRDS